MTSAVRAAAVAVLATVALSGCVRVLSDTTIYQDDTYSQLIILAVDPAVIEANAPGAMLPEIDPDQLADALAELPDSVREHITVTDYRDGDLEGIEVRLDRVPLASFDEAAQVVGGMVGGTATIQRVADTYVVTVAAPSGDDLGQENALGDLGLLASAIDVQIHYTFPGLVRSTTAGTIYGNTVTLGVGELMSGRDIVIVGGATSEIHWDPIVRWIIVALVAIAIVVIAALLVLQDRRSRRSSHLPPPEPPSTGGVGTLTM